MNSMLGINCWPRWSKLLVAVALLVPAIAGAVLPFATDQALPSLAPMLEQVQPAIVNISTTTQRNDQNLFFQSPFFQHPLLQPRQRSESSLGSGVIVNARRGYILTNHHVIDKADTITVTTQDGHELLATIVGSDPASDVAVIQVAADHLTEIAIGESAKLRVGDFVVAIGSPFGLSQTVTSGIVSALGRSNLGIEGYEDFIQTDASINPGNSGGALVNLRGELIGINTAIFSRGGGSVGIGLSIPVDMAMALLQQLVEHGEVQRGLLGVRLIDLTPTFATKLGLPDAKGAVITEVIANSAAAEKGLRAEDVILQFNAATIENRSDLRNAIGLVRPGTTARLDYYRDGKRQQIEVTIKEPVSITTFSGRPGQLLSGARFQNYLNDPTRPGIVVAEVQPGSPAAAAGLQENDLIIGVNRQRVHNVEEMEQQLRGQAQWLELIRDNRKLLLVIK